MDPQELQLSPRVLAARIEEATDELTSLVDKATMEGRDLTKSEGVMVDELEQRIQNLERRHKVAMRQENASRAEAGRRAIADGLGGDRVPAQARRHQSFKGFAGPTAGHDAWLSGHFLNAALYGNQQSMQVCREQGIWNAHSSNDNTKGGYLVPEPMADTIIRLVEDRGVFRRNTRVWPMSSASESIPRRSGGFTTYYIGEGQTITPSDMTFSQIKLEAKKLGVLTAIPSELNEDAISALADLLVTEIAYAFANAEDLAGFNGDGTSTYGGVVGLAGALQAGSVSTAASGNDSALTLDLTDFEAAVGKLPMYPGISPKWYVSSPVYWASMARLMDAAGGNTVENLGNGPVRVFLGYPVEFTQVLPATTGTLASTVLAYFGDLSMAATMGSRRDVRIETDKGLYFAEDKVAVRGTERYDINVHERGTASTAGPVIALKTAE